MKKLLHTFFLFYRRSCIRLFFLLLLFVGYTNFLCAQNKPGISINGIIKSENSEALQGVTITTKDGKGGTFTDSTGAFSLHVPGENTEVIFSYVGYSDQIITVGKQRTFNIILKNNSTSPQDVVVVAYGRQKKATLTGAVASVQGKELVSTPVSNISNMLVGNVPGLSGLQTSGEPGRNGASIYIRGVSTFAGNKNPLIVIDGVEQAAERAYDQLNAIDANEIENISVLKDASSTAVYGIRGANGVIIVTTKRGRQGKPVLSFAANYGITKATNLMHNATSYEYALMRNESINTEISTFGNSSFTNYLFTEDDLWKMKNNRDYTPEEVAAMTQLTQAQKDALNNTPALYYGSRDLFAEQFGNTGPQQQYNINISGGTANVKYFTSLGYFSQGSILNNTAYYGANTASSFKRYNFRSNFDITVVKNLTLSVNLTGQFGNTAGPGYINGGANPYDLSARYKAIMQYIFDSDPLTAPGLVEGKLVNSYNGVGGSQSNPLGIKLGSLKGAQNPIRNLLVSGTENLYNTLLSASTILRYNMGWLSQGLSLRATLNYDNDYVKSVAYQPSLPEYSVSRDLNDPNIINFYGGATGANNFISNPGHNSIWRKVYVDAGIEYNHVFGPHNIGGLILGKAQKYSIPSSSDNTPSGIMGLLGRATYNYKERYLVEFNVGYNGTEQFAEGNRFGFFPAYSAGWVISNESFFPKNDIVTFFKLRGSYGIVGNDQYSPDPNNARRYLYLPSTFNTGGSGYYWGNSDGSVINPYYYGSREGTIGNPDVTWEKAKKQDFGLDARFFKNKLSLTADYFKEDRNNILTSLGTIPYVYGVASSSVPPVNVGITTNHGYEVSLGWNDHAGSITYFALANVSYAKNKIKYMAEAPKAYPWMNTTGYAIGQYKGLLTDGFFNTTEELSKSPYNKYNANQVALGDVRYKDVNDDGFIDEKDVVPVGYSNLPQYSFSFKGGLSFKGFDISFLFTGSANGSFNLANYAFNTPFFQTAGNLMQWQYDGRWTADKVASGEKILYPRATMNGGTGGNANYLASDLWIVSNNFIRLKNAELGYTFPVAGFIKKANISSVRIYVNGNNLITWNKTLKDKGIDPESVDYGGYSLYPITRVFIAGINIQF